MAAAEPVAVVGEHAGVHVDQPHGDPVGAVVVVAHLGRVEPQGVVEILPPLEVARHRVDQLVRQDAAVVVDDLLDRGQRIDRRGDARAVQAEIVVLRAFGDVAPYGDRLLGKQGVHRRGARGGVVEDGVDPRHLRLHLPLEAVHERVEIGALLQMLLHAAVDQLHKGHRLVVDPLRAVPGDDELPAARDRVVARVLELVAPAD